jgi:hypothetical protein
LREILGAKWEFVDLERGLLNLPTSKTGKKSVFLSASALAVLSDLPRTEGNPHVIPGEKDGAPRVDLKGPWTAVTQAAGLAGLRLHDLRHSFASIGAGGGLGLPIIGKLLGHSTPAMTAKYAHLDGDPMHRAVNQIGNAPKARRGSRAASQERRGGKMTTPRTGRPRGRPKVTLREDDARYAILYVSRGMKPARAFLRAMLQLEFLAKKIEFSGRVSHKMNVALEKFGGQIDSHEIGYSGNRDKNYIDEKHIQGINRLRKKTKRYVTAEDIRYRITMGKIFMYTLFVKDVGRCAARIEKLSTEIGEEQMAAWLIHAMQRRSSRREATLSIAIV